jgi:hypothetical protein
MTPITCACERCRAMCAHSACVPTPAEARELMRRGYAARMAAYKPFGTDDQAVVAPAVVGAEGGERRRTDGRCTFHTEDGKCELHSLGLKPMEGRLAHHDRDWRAVRHAVNATWRGQQFRSAEAMRQRLLSDDILRTA